MAIENKVHTLQERRGRRRSKQWKHEPGEGSRCEKNRRGEADLQDGGRLVAKLVVKMGMGSCG